MGTLMKIITLSVATLLASVAFFVFDADPDEVRISEAPLSREANATDGPPELAQREPEPATRESAASSFPDEPQFVFVTELKGLVVDELGQPVSEARVALSKPDSNPRLRPLEEENTNAVGAFQFSRSEKAESTPLVLSVIADGFQRIAIRDPWERQPRGGWRIELKRGQVLKGEVVDEEDQPIPGLELIAFTANSGVDHVSPSQVRLRFGRLGANSPAPGCIAQADALGRVQFDALGDENYIVQSLDPEWLILSPGQVEPSDGFVRWRARRALGVRLNVIDNLTGEPLKARAVFRMDVRFDDGEETMFDQWIGHGLGEVSFLVGPGILPKFGDRKLVWVQFHGDVKVGGVEVSWRAPALEDEDGVLGVATVDVEVDPSEAPPIEVDDRPWPTGRFEIDVQLDDGSPCRETLYAYWRVTWSTHPRRLGSHQSERRRRSLQTRSPRRRSRCAPRTHRRLRKP